MTAPKLATALSFHYNDQNYCRTDGTLACLITSLITLAPQQGTDRPPGNSHMPEVQIKLSRFFLTVEAEPLTTCLKHSARLLGMLSPL